MQSNCGKRLPTKDLWNEHTIKCARKLRERLAFECAECDYATKRERDLERQLKQKPITKRTAEKTPTGDERPGERSGRSLRVNWNDQPI
jgi:hypothetical protein